MSHMRVQLLALTLGIAGAACSGAIPRQLIADYSHFSHLWTTPQLTLYWDCTPVEPGLLRIDGVGVNLWEPVPPRFLELIAYGVDAQSRVLSRTQGSAEGVELLKNFPAPFRLTLQEQAEEARVDLAYRYQYWDDSFEGFARWIPANATGRVVDACGQGRRRPREAAAERTSSAWSTGFRYYAFLTTVPYKTTIPFGEARGGARPASRTVRGLWEGIGNLTPRTASRNS